MAANAALSGALAAAQAAAATPQPGARHGGGTIPEEMQSLASGYKRLQRENAELRQAALAASQASQSGNASANIGGSAGSSSSKETAKLRAQVAALQEAQCTAQDLHMDASAQVGARGRAGLRLRYPSALNGLTLSAALFQHIVNTPYGAFRAYHQVGTLLKELHAAQEANQQLQRRLDAAVAASASGSGNGVATSPGQGPRPQPASPRTPTGIISDLRSLVGEFHALEGEQVRWRA